MKRLTQLSECSAAFNLPCERAEPPVQRCRESLARGKDLWLVLSKQISIVAEICGRGGPIKLNICNFSLYFSQDGNYNKPTQPASFGALTYSVKTFLRAKLRTALKCDFNLKHVLLSFRFQWHLSACFKCCPNRDVFQNWGNSEVILEDPAPAFCQCLSCSL